MAVIDFLIKQKYWFISLAMVIFVVELAIIFPLWEEKTSNQTSQIESETETIGLNDKGAVESKSPSGAKLFLTLNKETIQQGDNFEAVINLDSLAGEVEAVDVIIVFDPSKLQVEAVEPGLLFSDYPQNQFDNQAGKVILSGVSQFTTEEPAIEKGVVGTVVFKALERGESQIEIEFISGETTDSNVIVKNEVDDVLSEVENLQVRID